MKKILSLIVLALVIMTACAKTENTEQTSSKDIINQSSHQSSHESSQANQEKPEFKEFNGKIAMLTEDVNLKQPYVITTNADGDTVRLDMDEDVDCSLKKNDIVVVIDEKDKECLPQAYKQQTPLKLMEKMVRKAVESEVCHG